MARISIQASKRADKTVHYLQWWDNRPERLAVPSARPTEFNATFSIFSTGIVFSKDICNAIVKLV